MDIKLNKTSGNLNFQAGLNTSLRFRELCMNTEHKEVLFDKVYGTVADFKKNKAVALANTLCANIFGDIGQKLNIEIASPPAITVYRPKQMIEEGKYVNFCITDTSSVLKDEEAYPAGSIFFKDYSGLKKIDDLTEELYAKRKISSNHFLAMFIHEWLHSIHLDYLFKKFGYPGECNFLKQIYPVPEKTPKFKTMEDLNKKILSPEETEIVKDQLSLYSGEKEHQYFEVFSEVFTKLICSSLSDDCTRVLKNPVELLKQTPQEFQKIILKVINMD